MSENDKMMLGISPEFIDYRTRVQNGQRVVWLADIQFLLCFTSHFSGDHHKTICTKGNDRFELISEWDDDGNWELDSPIGIKFLCADVQLQESNTLLAKLSADGSLPVLSLLLDAIKFLKAQGKLPHGEEKRKYCAIACRMFRKEPVIIPATELARVFAGFMHH